MPPRKRKTLGLDLNQQRLDFSAVLASNPNFLEGESEGVNGPVTYTVSEITHLIEATLEASPVLGGSVVIRGEMSNVSQSARGHVYFTLKDQGASIKGILWASTVARLRYDLEDGMEVYLTGKLEIYKANGTYSIVGSKLESVGVGALQLAFQQIKARLEAEGLFMDEFKKEIPSFPTRIGIVTSRTGSVIHDMLRVIRRKNPMVNVLLHPAKVQGEGAALEIAAAIDELSHPSYNLDIIIVARGGGSFEDLFCFSEEHVVRAIFRCPVPVITGIGHEPDYSLADATADYSASTPTAAADWAVPDMEAILENLREQASELFTEMHELLLEHEQTLDYHATRLVELHEYRTEHEGNRLAQLQSQFLMLAKHYFENRESCLREQATELHALSPLATLGRGFAIPVKADGKSIRSVDQARPGERIQVKLADGSLDCDVVDVHAKNYREIIETEV